MSKPVIVIGTPCYGGLVTRGYVASLLHASFACMQAGIHLKINLLGGDALITRARSHITADFLDKGDATHLLFIDADISFSPDQLLRLVNFDKDMTAAMYPVKNIFWEKIGSRVRQGEPLSEAGLIYTARQCTGVDLRVENDFATAEYAATGFLLIKRCVFERMTEAYPQTKFKYLDAPKPSQPPRENLYALYDCMIDPSTGHYMSEDYAFCKRWRDIGGEIWIDLKSKLTHEGPFLFHGNTTQRFSDLHQV